MVFHTQKETDEPKRLNEKGFSGDEETSKQGVVVSRMMEERGRWEELHPEILALIFLRIPMIEMVRCLPLVCKAWKEVVAGPYCWLDIDLKAWSRRPNVSRRGVERVVKKLIAQSTYAVQRFSACRLRNSGFPFIANCGSCLKVLEIPRSGVTDNTVLKHLTPMPNLRVLNINHCSKITAKSLAAFGDQCKSLIHLKRNILPQSALLPINDSEAKTIADTMPNLQHIELCFGQFGVSGLSGILTKCKSLTHLDIRGCWKVKLDGDLKKMCEKLECFQIHRTDYYQYYHFLLGLLLE